MNNTVNRIKKLKSLAIKNKNIKKEIRYLIDAFNFFTKKIFELQKEIEQLQNTNQELEKKIIDQNTAYLEKKRNFEIVDKSLDTILKTVQQGIIFITYEGVISIFNQKSQELLDRSNLLNKRYWNHFSDDFFGFSISDCLKYGFSRSIKYLQLSNNKEVEVISRFIHSEHTTCRGLILLLKDITETEKLKKEKNRQERITELGKIVTTVAHEIKNPLGAIRGYASLLEKDLEGKQSAQEKAQYILEASKSLERIVHLILQHSRPLITHKTPHNLFVLINEVIRSIQVNSCFSKKIQIHTHFPNKNLMALLDSDLIRLCFFNIIANAFQAMGEVGSLDIFGIQRNSDALISFSDTGCGMDQKQMDYIFSPFFTTKQQGNGLGLSEVYKITQEHNGSIDVSSQINQGSTFTLRLPLKDNYYEN